MTTPDVSQGTTGVVIPTTMPSVNLLPAEIAEAARFRRMQFAMGAAVLGAVVVVGALYVHDHSNVSGAQSQLDTAKAQYATAQSQLSSLSSVSAVYQQVAAKQAMVQQAMGQEVDWSNYMSDLSLRIPDNVWLNNVAATESSTGLSGAPSSLATGNLTPTGIGQITFSGTAFSHDDVATWLDVLSKEKGFADAYFSNSTKAAIGPKSVVNFSSSVVMTDDAKSGRFTKPAGS
jgi:Tfp pilus assembly protein PilN